MRACAEDELKANRRGCRVPEVASPTPCQKEEKEVSGLHQETSWHTARTLRLHPFRFPVSDEASLRDPMIELPSFLAD